MNPPSLHAAIAPYLLRARTRATLRGAVDGAMVGAVAACGMLVAYRLLGVGSPVVAGLGFVAISAAGVAFARRRLPDDAQLLVALDADLGLKARVRTAWETTHTDRREPLAEAQIRDAVQALSEHTPHGWLPRLVPRRAWATPALVALAVAPLLMPTHGVAEPTLTAPQREAISAAADALRADDALSDRLRDAETVEDALVALADYEERADTHERSKQALNVAREALQGSAPNVRSPADALDDLAAASYPALQEQLRELRDKLARNATTAGLAQALEDVDTVAVTEATLRKIVEELRKLEDAAETAPLASLDAIREQKRAVALAAIESQGSGSQARTDGVAGSETGDMTAEGSRLGEIAAATEAADAMLLESFESESLRESRVYTRRRNADGSRSEPELLPFREAVANARADIEYAVRNDELPVAYRDRILRYFDALQKIAEEDAP
jgi:hypothetical protein